MRPGVLAALAVAGLALSGCLLDDSPRSTLPPQVELGPGTLAQGPVTVPVRHGWSAITTRIDQDYWRNTTSQPAGELSFRFSSATLEDPYFILGVRMVASDGTPGAPDWIGDDRGSFGYTWDTAVDGVQPTFEVVALGGGKVPAGASYDRPGSWQLSVGQMHGPGGTVTPRLNGTQGAGGSVIRIPYPGDETKVAYMQSGVATFDEGYGPGVDAPTGDLFTVRTTTLGAAGRIEAPGMVSATFGTFNEVGASSWSYAFKAGGQDRSFQGAGAPPASAQADFARKDLDQPVTAGDIHLTIERTYAGDITANVLFFAVAWADLDPTALGWPAPDTSPEQQSQDAVTALLPLQ